MPVVTWHELVRRGQAAHMSPECRRGSTASQALCSACFLVPSPFSFSFPYAPFLALSPHMTSLNLLQVD
jgi:hypothetical protein